MRYIFFLIAVAIITTTTQAQRPTGIAGLRVFQSGKLTVQQTGPATIVVAPNDADLAQRFPTTVFDVPTTGGTARVLHSLGYPDLRKGRRGQWRVIYPYQPNRQFWINMPKADGVWPRNSGVVRCANGRRELVVIFSAS